MKAKDTMTRVYKHLEKTFNERLETRRNFMEHHVSQKISRFWLEHLIDRNSRFRMFVTLERVHDLQWNLQTCKNYLRLSVRFQPMERRIEQVAVPGRARNSRNSGPFDTGLCLPSQSISLTQWKFYFPWNLPNLLAETFTLGPKKYSFDKVTRITTVTIVLLLFYISFLYFNYS